MWCCLLFMYANDLSPEWVSLNITECWVDEKKSFEFSKRRLLLRSLEYNRKFIFIKSIDCLIGNNW